MRCYFMGGEPSREVPKVSPEAKGYLDGAHEYADAVKALPEQHEYKCLPREVGSTLDHTPTTAEKIATNMRKVLDDPKNVELIKNLETKKNGKYVLEDKDIEPLKASIGKALGLNQDVNIGLDLHNYNKDTDTYILIVGEKGKNAMAKISGRFDQIPGVTVGDKRCTGDLVNLPPPVK
jgi:hypothetical protein